MLVMMVTWLTAPCLSLTSGRSSSSTSCAAGPDTLQFSDHIHAYLEKHEISTHFNNRRTGNRFWDGVAADVVDGYPKLRAVVDRVAQLPVVKKYYSAMAAENKMYACFVAK